MPEKEDRLCVHPLDTKHLRGGRGSFEVLGLGVGVGVAGYRERGVGCRV